MRMRDRYRLIILTLVSLVVTGIFGYMGIEGWSFLESLYMTILTFTTVGYNEVRPLSAGGRIFTILLMIGGVGVMLYALTVALRSVVEDELIHSFLRRRRVESQLSKLSGHFIICGFGRVGASVAEKLVGESVQAVIIDSDADALARVSALGLPYVLGSATEDESLRAARIDRARGLVAALGNDQDNVFVTLSARGLNPNLHIVARSSRSDSLMNLERAGADRVVSPYEIGGLRMAMSATRPLAVDLLDSAPLSSDDGQRITEVLVAEGSPLSAAPIQQACAPVGVRALAITRAGEAIIVHPAGEQTCLPGDRVILIGPSKTLALFEGQIR